MLVQTLVLRHVTGCFSATLRVTPTELASFGLTSLHTTSICFSLLEFTSFRLIQDNFQALHLTLPHLISLHLIFPGLSIPHHHSRCPTQPLPPEIATPCDPAGRDVKCHLSRAPPIKGSPKSVVSLSSLTPMDSQALLKVPWFPDVEYQINVLNLHYYKFGASESCPDPTKSVCNKMLNGSQHASDN